MAQRAAGALEGRGGGSGPEPARSEAQLLGAAAVLEQIAEGVIVTDESGAIILVNEAAARLHGVKRLDVQPDHYSEVYHLLTLDGAPYPAADLPLSRAVQHGEKRCWRSAPRAR
nr:PAS domain-containing protein [uncultured Sphingosinicella sp.]